MYNEYANENSENNSNQIPSLMTSISNLGATNFLENSKTSTLKRLLLKLCYLQFDEVRGKSCKALSHIGEW